MFSFVQFHSMVFVIVMCLIMLCSEPASPIRMATVRRLYICVCVCTQVGRNLINIIRFNKRIFNIQIFLADILGELIIAHFQPGLFITQVRTVSLTQNG